MGALRAPTQIQQVDQLRLYLGCGLHPVDGWENVDKSFGPLLSRHKHIKSLLGTAGVLSARQLKIEWSPDIRRVDVTKHFPWQDGSADAVFCDRMLGFLSRANAESLIANCYRVLRPGGQFRLVVFDLEAMVQKYVGEKELGMADAADRLRVNLAFGLDPTGPLLHRYIKRLVPNLDHRSQRWLYDFESLSHILGSVGFSDVRRCSAGVGEFPDLSELEGEFLDPSRSPGRLVIVQAERA